MSAGRLNDFTLPPGVTVPRLPRALRPGAVKSAWETLSDRQRFIVGARLGFEVDRKTSEALAAVLGIRRQRVQQQVAAVHAIVSAARIEHPLKSGGDVTRAACWLALTDQLHVLHEGCSFTLEQTWTALGQPLSRDILVLLLHSPAGFRVSAPELHELWGVPKATLNSALTRLRARSLLAGPIEILINAPTSRGPKGRAYYSLVDDVAELVFALTPPRHGRPRRPPQPKK